MIRSGRQPLGSTRTQLWPTAELAINSAPDFAPDPGPGPDPPSNKTPGCTQTKLSPAAELAERTLTYSSSPDPHPHPTLHRSLIPQVHRLQRLACLEGYLQRELPVTNRRRREEHLLRGEGSLPHARSRSSIINLISTMSTISLISMTNIIMINRNVRSYEERVLLLMRVL